MVNSLLSVEDLSSLLVFEVLSNDWVREVHTFTSQRKKGKTFVIFRNYRNRKLSSLEELKGEFNDSYFDNVQFISAHSHTIISNRVGANKIARKAAKAWMTETEKIPTIHDAKIGKLEAMKVTNVQEKNNFVSKVREDVPTQTYKSDDATIVKPIKQSKPEVNKQQVSKPEVSTPQINHSISAPMSTSPQLKTDSINKTLQFNKKEDNTNDKDSIKENTNKEKNISKIENKINTEDQPICKEFSKPSIESFSVRAVADALKENDFGEIGDSDEEEIETRINKAQETSLKTEHEIQRIRKEIEETPVILAKTKKPTISGPSVSVSEDTWVHKDIENIKEKDNEEETIGEQEWSEKRENLYSKTAPNQVDSQEILKLKTGSENQKQSENILIKEDEKSKKSNHIFSLPMHDTVNAWMQEDIDSMDDEDSDEEMNYPTLENLPQQVCKIAEIKNSQVLVAPAGVSDALMHEDIGILEDQECDNTYKEKNCPTSENLPEEAVNIFKPIILNKIGDRTLPALEVLQTSKKENEVSAAVEDDDMKKLHKTDNSLVMKDEETTLRSIHGFSALPVDDLTDAWMHEDIGVMEDEDSEEEIINIGMNNLKIENLPPQVIKIKENIQTKTELIDTGNLLPFGATLITLPVTVDACIQEGIGIIEDKECEEDIINEKKNCLNLENLASEAVTIFETKNMNKICAQPLQIFIEEKEVTATDDDKKTLQTVEKTKTKKEDTPSLYIPGFSTLPLDNLTDTWMHEDIGVMEDEDSHEDNYCTHLETSFPLKGKHFAENIINNKSGLIFTGSSKPEDTSSPFYSVSDDWMNENAGALEKKEIKGGIVKEYEHVSKFPTRTEKIGRIKNSSKNIVKDNIGLVEVLQTFMAENEDTKDNIVKEDDKVPRFFPIKENIGGKTHPSENIFDHDTGLMDVFQTFLAENKDTEEGIVKKDEKCSNIPIIKENIGGIKNLPDNIIDHNTGLIDVLQTFLAENEDTEEGIVRRDEKCSNIPTIKENIGGTKNILENIMDQNTGLIDVLQTFLAENEDTEEGIVRRDEKYSNIPTIKGNIGGIKNLPENIMDHNTGLIDVLQTFLAENEDTKEGIVRRDEKYSNIPTIKENIGGIKSPPENIIDHTPGVLQTFLADNESRNVGRISGDVSREPENEKHEDKIDLQTFLETEETDSEDEDSNSDESLNYDTEDSDLGSLDPESGSESSQEVKPLENGHK